MLQFIVIPGNSDIFIWHVFQNFENLWTTIKIQY